MGSKVTIEQYTAALKQLYEEYGRKNDIDGRDNTGDVQPESSEDKQPDESSVDDGGSVGTSEE
jgi:hypothetical protein